MIVEPAVIIDTIKVTIVAVLHKDRNDMSNGVSMKVSINAIVQVGRRATRKYSPMYITTNRIAAIIKNKPAINPYTKSLKNLSI